MSMMRLRFLVTTLVTSNSFWWSNSPFSRTNFGRAIEARLHTATCSARRSHGVHLRGVSRNAADTPSVSMQQHRQSRGAQPHLTPHTPQAQRALACALQATETYLVGARVFNDLGAQIGALDRAEVLLIRLVVAGVLVQQVRCPRLRVARHVHAVSTTPNKPSAIIPIVPFLPVIPLFVAEAMHDKEPEQNPVAH
eukprot:Opistho-2@68045